METSFVKRLMIVVISLFLVVYVGYQVYTAVYSPIEVEIAQAYSAYDTIDVEAMVIRDETVIDGATDGYLYYTCEDGARISKGGTIAYVYANEEDAMMRRRINRLDEEIEMLEGIVSQGSAGMMSIDLISKQMSVAMEELIVESNVRSYTDTADKRMKMLTLINKWRVMVGKENDFSARIAELKQQRQTISNSFSAARGTVKSPIAGYFVSQVDGFENSLSYDRATSMTVADIQRIQSSTETVTSDAVGKIVGDYQWYFVCIISAEQATKLTVGQDMSILLPFVSSTAVPVQVAALNRDRDGSVAASFVCSYMSDKLSAIRREKAEIRVKEYAGLYVRDEALHFNDQKESGVYIRVGDTVYFRKVDVIYHDVEGKYSVCKIVDDAEYLQLYDDVVVSGKGLYDGKIIR